MCKHAKNADSRGSAGMSSRKILKIRCQEIEFGGVFSGFNC